MGNYVYKKFVYIRMENINFWNQYGVMVIEKLICSIRAALL